MFNLIKSFFKTPLTLQTPTATGKITSFEITNTLLILKSTTKKLNFDLNSIKSKKNEKNVLLFSFNDEKYTLNGNEDILNEICEKMKNKRFLKVDYFYLEGKKENVVVDVEMVREGILHIRENESDEKSDEEDKNILEQDQESNIKEELSHKNTIHYEKISKNLNYTLKNNNTLEWLATDNHIYKIIFKDVIDFYEFKSVFNDVIENEQENEQENEKEFINSNSSEDLNSNETDQSNPLIEQNIEQNFEQNALESNKFLTNDDHNAFISRDTSLGIFTIKDDLKYQHTLKNISSLKDSTKILKNKNNNNLLIHNFNKLNLIDLNKEIENEYQFDSKDVTLKDDRYLSIRDDEILSVDFRVKDLGVKLKGDRKKDEGGEKERKGNHLNESLKGNYLSLKGNYLSESLKGNTYESNLKGNYLNDH